jgi:hypothetical protein
MHSLQFEGGLHGEGEAELPDPGEEEGWKNAWTRQQRIPAEEVVDEILTDTPTLAKKVEPEE